MPLGVEAVKAGRSVYFTTLADIVSALAKAEREGQLRERIRWFCQSALLIVDEIGYLPVAQGGGNLFFQLVNARYEKGAMILTSNRGFAEWGEVFGDPVVATALLDRLLHHAVVIQIEGSSYRLRQHADLMPEHLRSKAPINSSFPAPFRAAADGRQHYGRSIRRPADRKTGDFTSAQMGKVQPAFTVHTNNNNNRRRYGPRGGTSWPRLWDRRCGPRRDGVVRFDQVLAARAAIDLFVEGFR